MAIGFSPCIQTQKLNVYKNDEMTWDFTAQGLNIPQTSHLVCFEKIAHAFENQFTCLCVCWCSYSLAFFWGCSEMRDLILLPPFFTHYQTCTMHHVAPILCYSLALHACSPPTNLLRMHYVQTDRAPPPLPNLSLDNCCLIVSD